jgi:hypothetical protein
MPFCTNCGNKVDAGASYCAACGAPQLARTTPESQYTDFLDGISDRTASVLCYIPVFGVIPAIVFLASQKFRGNVRVRFNAFQSVYLFVAWLIVSSAMPVLILGLGYGACLRRSTENRDLRLLDLSPDQSGSPRTGSFADLGRLGGAIHIRAVIAISAVV